MPRRRRGSRSISSSECTVSQILAWADAYHSQTGEWPRKMTPGDIPGGPPEFTWRKVNEALRAGLHGLPGGSSLARLLTEYRQVRSVGEPPRLSPKFSLPFTH
jgi:hypothetical protein